MNTLIPINENDQEYKVYLSILKNAAKQLDAGASKKTFNDYMRGIQEKFPNFPQTNPRVMVIAYHMINLGKRFDPELAMTLINIVFASNKNVKDKNLLVIDVARYYTRLSN